LPTYFRLLSAMVKGSGGIQFMRWKTKTEDSLPISEELAKVIQEQQHYIQNSFGGDFKYLFCGKKAISEFTLNLK